MTYYLIYRGYILVVSKPGNDSPLVMVFEPSNPEVLFSHVEVNGEGLINCKDWVDKRLAF